MLFRSLLAVVLAAAALTSVAEAQNRRPLQNFNRIMGHWHGNGRHWRTPGHDSSYYNPWSAHNSGLVTRGYPVQVQSHFNNYLPTQNMDPFYTPRNGAPMQRSLPAAPLGGSYEPFGDQDVQEKVPAIEPAEGQPAPKASPDQSSNVGSQGYVPLSAPSTELPRDAYIYPASSSRAQGSSPWRGN